MKRNNCSNISRRQFVKMASIAAPSSLLLTPTRLLAKPSVKRTLKFHHTHTNEKFAATYHDGIQYDQGALQEINDFLKDFRTGDIKIIDPVLLDNLHRLQVKTGSRGTFQVISAYRSPKTNETLRSKSHGVAKRSYHMQGKAIDVRLSDVKTATLRKAARLLKQGGVGYYSKSDFLHIDTGPSRSW